MGKAVPTPYTLYATRTEAKYFKLLDDVALYRGKIINETIILEGVIDNIIVVSPWKNKEVKNALNKIFNSKFITFWEKEKILQSILLQDKLKDFSKRHSSFLHDLTKIRELRNSLAHSRIDTTSENIDNYDYNQLPLFKYENGKKKNMNIKMSELKSVIDYINTVLKVLFELYNNIKTLS